jgi:hypothetical protein
MRRGGADERVGVAHGLPALELRCRGRWRGRLAARAPAARRSSAAAAGGSSARGPTSELVEVVLDRQPHSTHP